MFTSSIDAISAALDAGVRRMINNLRDGPVRSDGLHTFGKGWHDFYEEADRSPGAHASLEGYLLCKHPGVKERLPQNGFDPDKQIFEDYLVPLFDQSKDDGWPDAKQDQRGEAEITTAKLAKFARCCHASTSPRRRELAQRALASLELAAPNTLLGVGHSIDRNDYLSSFATAENLRARYVWAESEAERIHLLRCVLDYISPNNDELKDNPWRLEEIPWIRDKLPLVSAVYTTCIDTLMALRQDDPIRLTLKSILDSAIRQDYFLMGDIFTETYSFRDRTSGKSRTDYFSFEVTLALLPAIFSGVTHGLCPRSYLDYIQPTLQAWKSVRICGYCNDMLVPLDVHAQKNRFSCLAGILRSLALAEAAFRDKKSFINPRIPMFVNPIRFGDRGVVPDGKTAFLAIPFKEDTSYQKLETRLRLVCSKNGFDLFRTDDLTDTTRDITQKIWRDLCASSFVVAVCDEKNANVYYEIGLAHALGKPVFLCASSADQFSFDVRGIEYSIYDDSKGLEHDLAKFIRHLKPVTI